MKRRGPGEKRARREVDVAELEGIVEQARPALSSEQHEILKSAVGTLAEVTLELEQKGVSIRRLRRLLFGATTEKTDKVLGRDSGAAAGDEQGGGAVDTTPEDGGAGETKKRARRR